VLANGSLHGNTNAAPDVGGRLFLASRVSRVVVSAELAGLLEILYIVTMFWLPESDVLRG
jgi:hypothetical protein